ncbi:2-oxoglutarate dehydrogenase complex E2 component, partial [Linnemannia elongata]
MISAVRSSKQVVRAARPLAALSKTTLFSVPAVQARRHLTINAAAASAVATQRLSSPYRTQVRHYADYVVKVPHMADSISEGSLKQWNKKVGDFVALDEEIATIETDK